jgi:hypothetical protein
MYFQLYNSTHPTEGIESGLLPTPRALTIEENLDGWQKRMDKRIEDGMTTISPNLHILAMRGMLPTPTKSDFQPRWKTENWEGNSDLPSVMNEMLGTRSHLSPQFVLEMMGFPTDWTLLPFLSGETSQSKQEEMP